MSQTQKYKARFSTKLPSGDFLGVTIFPGKTDPNAEVISVQVRRQTGEGWETISRIAMYRTPDGRYSLLPERQAPAAAARAEPIGVGASGESYE